jgi:putative phosphoesterase
MAFSMADRRAAPLLKVGVVSDTHIPDRVSALHPDLLSALRSAGVQVILHAGDISRKPVLDQLREIAPVHAVQGNRDWFMGPEIPLVNLLELAGVSIALMHGHGGWVHYLVDKIAYMRVGYRFERYLPLLQRAAQGAQVIVYGHTHHSKCAWVDGQLVFNPGSASFGAKRTADPSWGLLSIFQGGKVKGEVFYLRGYQVQQKTWVKKRMLRES